MKIRNNKIENDDKEGRKIAELISKQGQVNHYINYIKSTGVYNLLYLG